jgi:multidrug resistance efflux pump
MADLNPIPIPWRQRWRNFRAQGMPALVFGASALGVVYLWDPGAGANSITGEVTGLRSELSAPVSGALQELRVRPFQVVIAGEQIGSVQVMPELRMQAALEVLHAEIALAAIGSSDLALTRQRNWLNWQSLRRDWLQVRAEAASLRVRAEHARRESERLQELFNQNRISSLEFERARAEAEALLAEEGEKRRLAEELGRTVARSEQPQGENSFGMEGTMQATLDWLEKRLRQLEADLQPVPLVAPISGVITAIHRQAGEYIREGDPVVEIRSERASHIVGYVRQPLRVEPREGMAVQVTVRGRSGRGEAQILEVGPQFETLAPVFQRSTLQAEERALPLLISLPPNLSLRPGELLDLRLAPVVAATSG